jgi:hypothetical protein
MKDPKEKDNVSPFSPFLSSLAFLAKAGWVILMQVWRSVTAQT